MASMAGFHGVFGSSAEGGVPGSQRVGDLEAALGLVRGLGGSVRSETRTAPGIGSWAFVAGPDGTEVVLWEDATAGF